VRACDYVRGMFERASCNRLAGDSVGRLWA
jgi:hypothetical protein